jgi:hypothetical protein
MEETNWLSLYRFIINFKNVSSLSKEETFKTEKASEDERYAVKREGVCAIFPRE